MQVSAVNNSLNNQVLFAGKEKKQEAAKQNYTMYKENFVRNTAIAAGTGAVLTGIATKKPLFAVVGGISFTTTYWLYKTLADHFRREGKGENDNLGKNLLIAGGIGAAAGALLGKKMIGRPFAEMSNAMKKASVEGLQEADKTAFEIFTKGLDKIAKYSRLIAATFLSIVTAELYLEAKTPYDQITKK